MERGSVVEQVLDLQTGRATLVVAVPEESRIETVADLAGAKVATEFRGSRARSLRSTGLM